MSISNLYLRRKLLRWYELRKRDLPWRQNRDPYRIWLSEIMLQQTRVAAVIEYYQRFLQRFPSIEKLAQARERSVLAAWSGLGYYRRARMLHATAKQVVKDHGGRFPNNAEGLQTLPGIGRYTAAAIASIAFDEPVAVVDGNVERVLGRLLSKDLPGEEMWKAAQALLDRKKPGDFNQAMMELGATVCLPRQPLCLTCPVHAGCATRGEGVAVGKPSRQHKREVTYTLARRNGSIFLVQRPRASSLMPGMWELPETHNRNGGQISFQLRHSITVTDYNVAVVEAASPSDAAGQWIETKRLATFPLTGLARKILRAAQIL
jgi:A/G-specific adenine glycosylase